MSEPNLPKGFVAALQALTVWLESEQVLHITIGGVAVPQAHQKLDSGVCYSVRDAGVNGKLGNTITALSFEKRKVRSLKCSTTLYRYE